MTITETTLNDQRFGMPVDEYLLYLKYRVIHLSYKHRVLGSDSTGLELDEASQIYQDVKNLVSQLRYS